MNLSDHMICPEPDRAVNTLPELFVCPGCGDEVEILADEKKGKCPNCGRFVKNREIRSDDDAKRILEDLIRLAYSLGASEAKIVSPDDIIIENSLADLCSESQCENYGLAPSCPPHVSGPLGFRELQKKVRYALALRISVPSAALFTDQRWEIMRLLHEATAGIELSAVKAGYNNSQAFAGSSCKKIFCNDHADCCVLSKHAECRYPHYARPSMSGFGINVSELMKVCEWPADINTNPSEANTESMSWVAGLVLIG